ncbi:MAG TPA: enoyl-CoA hydratase/isomerase family protein [Rhizomicrobium sp.]
MIDLGVSGQVAVITMHDGACLSAHSRRAGTALRDAILACGDRDDVKAIVLRSAQADFCPPAQAIVPDDDKLDAPEWSQIYASTVGIYQALCYSKKVTITAVQGRCALAGSALVLCSDLTFAAADAEFHAPFERLPEANFVLAALTMRLARAKSWTLGGAPMDARRALEVGLVNRIALSDVFAEAVDAARSIAKGPLDGIAMSKLMMESFLDSQGVGQEFDMAGFYAATLPGAAAPQDRA